MLGIWGLDPAEPGGFFPSGAQFTPFTEPPYNCFGIGKVSQLRNLDVQRDVEKLRNAEIGDFLMTGDLLAIFVDGG